MKTLILFLLLSIITFAEPDSVKVKQIEQHQATLEQLFEKRKAELVNKDSVCVWLRKEYFEAEKSKQKIKATK